MYCNQIFSLINEGKIQNIIVADNYTVANDIARSLYGNDAMAVDTTLYPVSIGFSYSDGIFIDLEGNVVERNQTESEKIIDLTNQLTLAVESNVENDFRLCKIELGM
jgi:hypothetical protein